MDKNPLLSVIIVNYNTSSLLQTCVGALYASLKLSDLTDCSEIIVVDNASKDDSVKMLTKKYPDVLLLLNNKNVGFAKANNQGIEKSKGEYILLLNSDARVCDDAIEKSIRLLKQEKTAGVVSGKLIYEDGTLQKSAGFFPHLISVFNWMFFVDDIPLLNFFLKPYHVDDARFYEKSQQTDWVSGAYFFFRREIIEKAGLLDDAVFMYGEEVEWCYRIKKAGFEIRYDPSFRVVHDKGGSSLNGKNAGIVEEFRFIIYFYGKYKPHWQQNLVRFILKAGSRLRSILFGIIPRYRLRKELYEKAAEVVG